MNNIIHGDSLIELKKLQENSVDAIVTDPPYGLSFMGKKWDYDVPSTDLWIECLRVLKPGGYLLAFAGTRTQHRMAVRIEDAGFEIRDMIAWVYSTGFPKSLNIGKAIDKLQGAVRSTVKVKPRPETSGTMSGSGDTRPWIEKSRELGFHEVADNNPITDDAKEWEGWGTALKPALEPVGIYQKPLQVEQIFAIIIDNIWKQLPASDVIYNLRDTQAKLNEVVDSVPESVRTSFLESLNSVELAKILSMSHKTNLNEVRVDSVQENAARFGEQPTQEIKTPFGKEEDVNLMDISISAQMGDMSESIVLSWKNISEELLNQANKLTISMAIRKITELKTLRYCLLQNTSSSTGLLEKTQPNLEPITVARKPLSEKTVAENVLKWGTGGINIDGSRVEGMAQAFGNPTNSDNGHLSGKKPTGKWIPTVEGRFPANLIHDGSEEVVAMFPNDNSRFFYCAKTSKSERNKGLDSTLTVKYNGSTCKEENIVAVQLLQKDISDSGLMSFSTGESGENIMVQCRQDSLSTILTETNRIIGLKIYSSLMLSLTNESTQGANSEMEIGGNLAENVADLKRWLLTTTKGSQELALGASRVVLETLSLISVEENWKKLGNFHATVKPIKLMEYLVSLVSKEGAVILDPFAGSGSTGIACKNLNRNYVLIERESEYVQIINSRLQYHE